MKEIRLTQGQVALVDDEDYEALARFKWQAIWNATAQTYYARRSSGPGKVYMHRQVTDALVGEEVDHINHNGLDNRRGNLRRCSVAQNRRNARKRARCSSQFKGVRWNKQAGKWQAMIMKRHLGFFADETKAALAYNKAARQEFGEYALLNEVAA